ncbi:MAG TPA: TonB-dependent receptor [Thermoanaerobaculia bacterium]|nr:TonB-dependent receptor [Thermoanaerobaculia bacterium]
MNWIRSLRRALFSIAFLATIPLVAQTQTGQLTGTVTQDGTPLPGVRVTVSSPALQGSRSADTDINGNYNIPALPPGEYTAEFSLEGLQSMTRRVSVTLAGIARADAAMKLSAVSETITVTANTPSVVETPTMESNVSAQTVENLPILRTLISTVTLTPNTNQNGPGGATTISGATSFDSTFYINGTPVNEVLRGQPLSLFIEDALQETTVLTGGISAEYGRFTGGVVNAISKSGGNVFAGSLRDSLTNPSWASSTPLKEKLLDKLSQTYEGTFGGRIIADRLWFFTAGRYVNASAQNFFLQSTQSFNTQSTQKRIEAKFTGQINPKHSVVASILKLTANITDRCLANGCWDPASLSEKETQPQDLYSGNYNGILTNNLLVEAFASKSDLKFQHSGGPAGDVLTATPFRDANTGAFSGASQFCATCGTEVRQSKTFGVKPHYFLSTQRGGTHNIIAGVEHFTNSILSNNHQSGSDYEVYNFASPTRDANGNVLEGISPGSALILWWPILQNARPDDFASTGVFVNDRWDFTSRLNFNLGARYDKNDGTDSAGKKVAKDSKVSPRLGVTYDVAGNGRLRLNASYSEYVSKIQSGNIGDASSPAGSPSLLYWLYNGPEITGLPHDQFIKSVFDWFNSTGGINNRKFLGSGGYLLGGGTNGVSTQIQGSLKSPSVREIAFGASTQIGRNGFLRLDYQDRVWKDFYEAVLNLGTGTIFDPLIGADVDRGLVTNGSDLSRKYRAAVLQGGYRLTSRLNVAGNYTYSTLKGNQLGETQNAGPVADLSTQYYPEITGFARHNPVGYLPQDQRHKLRAWATYDLPSRIGRFNVSVLERYDSGTPFAAIGTVDPIASGVKDPGYLLAASASAGGFNYYFTDRAAFRWDNVTATDLGLNYTLPVAHLGFFAQADIINAFNEHAVIGGNTTVSTAFNSSRFATFNPFTDTPVECPQGAAAATCRSMGANWQKGSKFGTATDPTNYQTARTYRLSVGFKF